MEKTVAQGVASDDVASRDVNSVLGRTLNRMLFQPEAKEYIFAFTRQRVKRRAIDHQRRPPTHFRRRRS